MKSLREEIMDSVSSKGNGNAISVKFVIDTAIEEIEKRIDSILEERFTPNRRYSEFQRGYSNAIRDMKEILK